MCLCDVGFARGTPEPQRVSSSQRPTGRSSARARCAARLASFRRSGRAGHYGVCAERPRSCEGCRRHLDQQAALVVGGQGRLVIQRAETAYTRAVLPDQRFELTWRLTNAAAQRAAPLSRSERVLRCSTNSGGSCTSNSTSSITILTVSHMRSSSLVRYSQVCASTGSIEPRYAGTRRRISSAEACSVTRARTGLAPL